MQAGRNILSTDDHVPLDKDPGSNKICNFCPKRGKVGWRRKSANVTMVA